MFFNIHWHFRIRRRVKLLEIRWFRLVIVYLAVFSLTSFGFLWTEKATYPELDITDAIWWAFVTMTTVGYGDLYPSTFAGRYFVAIPSMLIGIGTLGYMISEVSATLVDHRSRKRRGMTQITYKDHILIIHHSSDDAVLKIVKELLADPSTQDQNICLIDSKLTECPKYLHELDVDFVQGNPSKMLTLSQAGAKFASRAILLSYDPGNSHSDDNNLSTVLLLKKINPNIQTVVEIVDPDKSEQFELAGANSVICSSQFSSNLIIQELQDPGIKEIFLDLTSNQDGKQVYITNLTCSEVHTYKDLIFWGLDNGYSILGLMGIDGPELGCESSHLLLPADRAIVIGSTRPEGIQL